MRGDRLTKLRQERHLSQRELGEIILVSGYTISAYELGRSDPSDDIKVRLAEYFDVSVDYLIGLIDEPLSYRRDANVVMLPRNLSEGQKESLRAFPFCDQHSQCITLSQRRHVLVSGDVFVRSERC